MDYSIFILIAFTVVALLMVWVVIEQVLEYYDRKHWREAHEETVAEFEQRYGETRDHDYIKKRRSEWENPSPFQKQRKGW